jgi:hypothetical protein
MIALRPRIRIAWWAAVLATAAAYAFRALFVLGGDFRPQLPGDAVIGGLLAVLLVARLLVGRWATRENDDAADDKEAGTRTDAGDHDPTGAGAAKG